MAVTDSLAAWFTKSKRDLPWRDNPTPYQVWVSEVMLQQTQVSVVIPYFMHWMNLFPTICDLAKANIDEVIKAWEGLGYYSRARNLHEGSRYVVEHHQGELPDSWEELSKIKGLGPYTIGAILSFAFHRRVPAVDGNVIRVLTRFFGIVDDIAKSKTQKILRDHALKLLPEKESWIISEALIELGATVCQKQPKCRECPLRRECAAYKQGVTDQLPYKSTKIQYEKLHRTVAVIVHEGAYLVRRGEEGQIMNGLHEFPYFEEAMDEGELRKSLRQSFKLDVNVENALQEVHHSFTRYRVKLNPFFCRAKNRKDIVGYEWREEEELKKMAFSSGHRRVWNDLLVSSNFKYL